jgi:hypothetical protein
MGLIGASLSFLNLGLANIEKADRKKYGTAIPLESFTKFGPVRPAVPQAFRSFAGFSGIKSH